jgi:hypothetical protein
LDGFQGEVTRVRCFAHIFNLVVKVRNTLLPFHSRVLTDLLSYTGYPLTVQKANKATTDSDEDSEDNVMISRLQEEDDDEEVDPDVDDDDNDDEIDSAVEASDNAMVDDIVRDLEQDSFGEEMLTREDINLGRFSLSKVRSLNFVQFPI